MRAPHLSSLALVVAIQLQLDNYDDTILDYRRRSSAGLVEQPESNSNKSGHVFSASLPCIQPIDALASRTQLHHVMYSDSLGDLQQEPGQISRCWPSIHFDTTMLYVQLQFLMKGESMWAT